VDLLAQGFDHHAIGANQSNEPQRRGKLLRVVELRGIAKRHAGAGVDEGIEVKVFLLEKELDDQLVEPGVEIPVEGSQVVAGDVVAIVGEFDTLTLPLAPPLPLHPATKDLAGHQLEPLELGHQIGGKDRLELFGL
jgi:hypothetical protein